MPGVLCGTPKGSIQCYQLGDKGDIGIQHYTWCLRGTHNKAFNTTSLLTRKAKFSDFTRAAACILWNLRHSLTGQESEWIAF